MDERVRLQCWTGSAYEDVEGLIRPRLGAAELREIEKWRPLLRDRGEGDMDWDWRRLVEEAGQTRGREMETGALMLKGRVQGAILFWASEEPSRIDGGPLLYVDRLAVAPANRSRAGRRGRISGCGYALMSYARERSRRLGCGGRVGLHSLAESEGFYRKLGMKLLEPRSQNAVFAYFEWPAEELG